MNVKLTMRSQLSASSQIRNPEVVHKLLSMVLPLCMFHTCQTCDVHVEKAFPVTILWKPCMLLKTIVSSARHEAHRCWFTYAALAAALNLMTDRIIYAWLAITCDANLTASHPNVSNSMYA